jgi:protoporphyrinogen oxidase
MSRMQLKASTVILGGGLTGLSAAWHLRGQDYLLLEKDGQVGGLARTDDFGGFKFDWGSHVWFTRDDYADAFVRTLPGVRMNEHQRSAWVHIYDRLIPAPFQANLYGLPLPVVSDCLTGYMKSARSSDMASANLADRLRSSFGEGMYRHFMEPYNSKVWTVPPEDLTADWYGTRIDVPDARELVDGAIGLRPNPLGLNAQFSYPLEGTQSLASAVAEGCPNVVTHACASGIDLQDKVVILDDGRLIGYERLISTMPLPGLVELLSSTDDKVAESARSLRWTKLVLVSICLKRKPAHDRHWIYFSEARYPFFRVHFPHNYSDAMCPERCGSVQAECAFPSGAVIDIESTANQVRASLADAGYISSAEVVSVYTRVVNPAYVLYDHGRRGNLDVILPFLRDHGIYSCGRFGGWEYLNMDGCILVGKEAAEWAIRETSCQKWQEQAQTDLSIAGSIR